nr:MAG TPA: hypothetical protein [Caudoviricetes sp.]
MDKKVFNHNNIRYERVSRAEAKKEYERGKTIILSPCKIPPFGNADSVNMTININSDYPDSNFDVSVKNFESIECISNSVGLWAAFYVARKTDKYILIKSDFSYYEIIKRNDIKSMIRTYGKDDHGNVYKIEYIVTNITVQAFNENGGVYWSNDKKGLHNYKPVIITLISNPDKNIIYRYVVNKNLAQYCHCDYTYNDQVYYTIK